MKHLTYVEIDVDVYRITAFQAAVPFAALNNWTLLDGANTTLVGHSDESLPLGTGALLSKTVSNDDVFWKWNLVPDMEDVSLLARFMPQVGAAVSDLGLVARATGTNTYYLCYLNTSTNVLEIYKVVAGVKTQLDSVNFAFNPGDLIWVRFDVATTADGVLCRAKAWLGAIGNEPEDFMAFDEDIASPIAGVGGVGIATLTSGSQVAIGMFRAKSLLGSLEETIRFARPTNYLPPDIEAIPNIVNIQMTPVVISLGKDIGARASVAVTFKDHPGVDLGELAESGTYWGKFYARYGTKLRGKNLRVIQGTLGQALTAMDTRHYVIDMSSSPAPDGAFQIQAVDPMKFADDDRAMAPVLSNGKLAGSIAAGAGTANLVPVGIGNAEYPVSGFVNLGGKEVAFFTRSGDVLTLTRGQLGTTAISHSAGDRAQLVLRYDSDDAADVIYDLLTGFAGVPPEFIILAEWLAETAAHLDVIFSRTITEPTPVKKLVSEVIEQAALAIWWDDRARVLRLRVLREIATDADTFTEDTILAGSLKIVEQPAKRISEIWTYYGQRDPTDRGDNDDNYRATLATVDLDRATEYGSTEIAKIVGTWIQTESAAERLNTIQISSYRDPPRRFNFDLFHGSSVSLGGGYRIRWRMDQDELGIINEQGAPIQIVKVTVEPGMVRVEAEEMLITGEVILTVVIFLTTTGSLLSFIVPDDFNSADNSIHCIGGGGGGAGGAGGGGGGGGGGGAYSRKNNVSLTPGGSVSYRVGTGGLGGNGSSAGSNCSSGAGTNGGDTWFNGATFAAASCAAEGGLGGPCGESNLPGGSAGDAADGIGDLKTSGGDGGRGYDKGGANAGGGGGGGAGGPNGNGGRGGGANVDRDGGAGGGGADGGEVGGEVPNQSNGGAGGDNRFNFGGGVGGTESTPPTGGTEGGGGGGGDSQDSDGAPGGAGEALWTQTIAPIANAGPGGGGGGGGSFQNGGSGGLYGGGGGGGGQGGDGGPGAQGLIVIIYRELAAS